MNQHWHRCMEQTDSCQRKGGEEPTGRKKVKGLAKNIHEVCPEGIKPCNMKNTDIYWRRYKIQETLYLGQWCLSPLQSRHLETSHSSPSHHHLSHHIFLNLNNGLKSLPFQRWFQFWEDPEVTGHQIWAVGVWVTWVIWCFTNNLCTRHDAWVGLLLRWSCQSPVAHSCGFWIIWIVSVEECQA